MVLTHLDYEHLTSKINNGSSPENIHLSLFFYNHMPTVSYRKYKEKMKVEFNKKQNHQVEVERGVVLSDLHRGQT